MLLFFPAALAAVSGGFWLLKRHGGRVSPRLRKGYLWSFVLLCLAVAVVFPVARQHGKYLVLFYTAVLACFAALNLGLTAAVYAGSPGGACPHAASRRRFLVGGAMAAAGSLVSLAGVDAATGPGSAVSQRLVELPRHPDAAPGRPLRLSLVSDLHAGFFLPPSHLAEAAGLIAAFKPDAILFGGDLVEYELAAVDEVRGFFRRLAGLAPVYAVLGNHDCYIDPDAVAAFHRLCGATPLRGESVRLAGPWGAFALCGLRDVNEKRMNFACLEGRDPASTIVLAHNPQTALMMPSGLVPWLTLSGHTHGGQIRLPLMGAMINQADRRIKAGVNEIDGRRIAVSAGLGYSGLPVRVLCPPDVTNIVVS